LTLLENVMRKVDSGLAEVLGDIGKEMRRRVREYDGLGSLRVRDDGDTTHSFDVFSESAILTYLKSTGLGFRFNSEESAPVDIGHDQDFTIIVDPLDGSSMLARGYPLASVAVTILRSEDNSPVLSRILEVFTNVQYAASDGEATRNGKPVVPSGTTALSDAFLVTYSATESRMASAAFRRICRTPPRLTLNYGGPLDLAKVGSGQCDLALELHKGFPPRDYIPGLHFARTAGAVAAQPDGSPVPYLTGPDDRMRFIVAGNRDLLNAALNAYAGDAPGHRVSGP
jgi:fructose-1,6-bisphosphatase/inositol monophosphatase family enzyme